MAIIQSTPNPQAGGGSRGEPHGEPAPAPPAADRGRDPAEPDPATATGHTTPGAGSAVDLGDELTATDGSAAGDPNPSAL